MAALRFRSHVVLVAACLLLYVGAAAQVRTPRGSGLYVAVAALTRPVLSVANWIGGSWVAMAEHGSTLRTVRSELRGLRNETARLRRENQLLAAELSSLRQGSALLSSFPSLLDGAVVARVVARDLVTSHTIRLDRGSADGIRRDAPVVAGAGVLGRVDRVGTHSARVQLLTHPAAAAAARIVGVQGEYLLMGADPPRLTGLPPFISIPRGTPILSTGSEGIYPPDLLLGTSGDVSSDKVFTVVDVVPAADPTTVAVVLVIPPASSETP